jgi:hypothetical protein
MVFVSIGHERVALSAFRPGWLFEQLERQARRGGVCVRVDIDEGMVQLALTTPGCGGGGGGRRARPREVTVIERWSARGLTKPGWSPASLISFLAELPRLL